MHHNTSVLHHGAYHNEHVTTHSTMANAPPHHTLLSSAARDKADAIAVASSGVSLHPAHESKHSKHQTQCAHNEWNAHMRTSHGAMITSAPARTHTLEQHDCHLWGTTDSNVPSISNSLIAGHFDTRSRSTAPLVAPKSFAVHTRMPHVCRRSDRQCAKHRTPLPNVHTVCEGVIRNPGCVCMCVAKKGHHTCMQTCVGSKPHTHRT